METLKSFLAGWAGGAALVVVGHPFDTVKTRLQAAPELYPTAMQCFRATVKKEGFLGLYAGAKPVLFGIGPVFALYYAVYDTAAAALAKTRPADLQKGPQPMSEVFLCGAATGCFASFALGPAELIKVRQQTFSARGEPSSLGVVVRSIGGVRGIFRGTGATMLRDTPASIGWFGAYELTKRLVSADPNKPTIAGTLFAGGMAGIANWLICMPLDAIKTAIQVAPSGPGAPKVGLMSAARAIHAKGGVGGFYRGLGPILLRAFPANAACFAVKDQTLRALHILSPPKRESVPNPA